jgi:glycosyltransferase involved in cell wall biosynthesis
VSARLARWAFARADAVCPPSESLRERMEAAGWPGRLRVVPNVVDTERFTPPPGTPTVDGPPRIVAVAAFEPVKGLEELIEAAGLLAQRGAAFRLDLVGDGLLRAPLERRAVELGLAEHTTFHGTLPSDEVAGLMRVAAFAVVPSRWETFSVALSEAMACGLPVVATAVGALPERVDERTRILVAPRDSQALADGLATMLERHDAFDRAAIAADVRKRFAPPVVAAAWDAVYSEAAAHRASRR